MTVAKCEEMSWSGTAQHQSSGPSGEAGAETVFKENVVRENRFVFPTTKQFSTHTVTHNFKGTPSKRYMNSPNTTPRRKKKQDGKENNPATENVTDDNMMDVDVPPLVFKSPGTARKAPGGGVRRKKPGQTPRTKPSPWRKKKKRVNYGSYLTPRKFDKMKSPGPAMSPSPRAAAYLMRRVIARSNATKSPGRHVQSMKLAVKHMLSGFDLNNLKTLHYMHSLVQAKMNDLHQQEFTNTRQALEIEQEAWNDSEPEEETTFLQSVRRSMKNMWKASADVPTPMHKKAKINKEKFDFENISRGQLEPQDSPHMPVETAKQFNLLHEHDRKFALELVKSAQLTKFKLPEFSDLVQHDEDNTEYNFEMQFQFGFSTKMYCHCLAKAFDIRKRLHPHEEEFPRDCSNLIAAMLGSNQFEVLLKVYFDKSKANANDWHEQDGEAWLYHPEAPNGKKRDLVNFDREARIYYVESWPSTGIISDDDYTNKFLDIAIEEKTERLERIIITWVCSQITWIAFDKSVRSLSSKMATKRLSKLLFVLKGWYTGLLLGESFDPVQINDIENWGVSMDLTPFKTPFKSPRRQ